MLMKNDPDHPVSTCREGCDIGDIFRQYGPAYRKIHQIPYRMVKVMRAIERCKTASLGGHVFECDQCGHQQIAYNSCRNRHCPQCQAAAREKWLDNRRQELLPVKYFHIVFTIPDSLNPIALQNQTEIYKILFKASSETLLELSLDPKHLGAKIGFIAMLHTWGQNLLDHPHIHMIVPAGGLSYDDRKWIASKKNFFIHVKVLSRMFRGKFLDYLQSKHDRNGLSFDGKIECFRTNSRFKELVDSLYRKEWVVYSKPSFKHPEAVLNYLGRYTHRVAITNHRITHLENDRICFRWKDYRNENKNKIMSLDIFEFIRRFLLHVLPGKFVKIRHYGFLSNRNKARSLQRCRKLLGKLKIKTIKTLEDLIFELSGLKYHLCPVCARGQMIEVGILEPVSHAPPYWYSSTCPDFVRNR